MIFKKKYFSAFCSLIFFLLAFSIFYRKAFSNDVLFPNPMIPDSWGLHVSFVNPRPGELKMLSETGAHWIRVPFYWCDIEKNKGEYNFSAHDRLVSELAPYNIHPIFTLWFSNPNYDQNFSPFTEDGRQAFARWISASVKHFVGKGIIWEMWNEPNIGRFWKPHVKVEDYIKLALAVGQAIREVSPQEVYVGPSVARMDFKFLEACFKANLLEYWSGVTVHPYRNKAPETWGKELEKLKNMINKYAPNGRSIPIISGEWGYSEIYPGLNENLQSKYLLRQYLYNLSESIPLTIWFDWWDDGQDPKDKEHHFGTVKNTYHDGQSTVFDPKPAYFAAKKVTSFLNGFQFSHRLTTKSKDDFILVFKKGSEIRIAAWTTKKPHSVFISAPAGSLEVINYLGEKLPPITSNNVFKFELNDAPQYLVPETTFSEVKN
jgi:polysaccharide biosynthesis protein PslG